MKATAYCPGHITGFFFPCEHEEPLRSGSRGAGLCIDRGATTTVTARKGQRRISVWINGKERDAPVTKAALKDLLGTTEMELTIDSWLDLPESAGFGMSAAGALSAALALAAIMELPSEDAFAAAHRAELANRTGLGDVAALTRGGLTFRKKEGLPPYGRIDRLADELDLVAAVVGAGMHTADVLGDVERRNMIKKVGEECYQDLCLHPTVDDFFRISRSFTDRSGIATLHVKAALDAVDGLGDASMIMLGNAVFCAGQLEEIEELLAVFGPTFRLSLDVQGPRVLVLEDRSQS